MNSHTLDRFLSKHHLLTVATCNNNMPYCANLFYAYDSKNHRFIVASEEKTKHIQDLHYNQTVAGSVALETKEVGKIEGIQFRAIMHLSESREDRKLYYEAFAYAKVMQPTLYVIELKWVKLTDNRLGFGKKLIFEF